MCVIRWFKDTKSLNYLNLFKLNVFLDIGEACLNKKSSAFCGGFSVKLYCCCYRISVTVPV